MTDKTHFDTLLDDAREGLGKLLIGKFTKLMRDQQGGTASYSASRQFLITAVTSE